MAELRVDPLTGDFIIVNDKRMNRPVIITETPSENCPFCEQSSKRHPGLPLTYEALAIDNLYPSLTFQPDQQSVSSNEEDKIFTKMPNIGKCEVLLYSSNHNMEFYDQPDELTLKIMFLWQKRFLELQKYDVIKYIFIFENRGQAVGVTIPHPHGQLYALPIIPPVIKRILKNYKKYYKNNNICIQCSIISKEIRENKRIIEQNEFFIAFVPYYAKMLYEVQIVPKKHFQNIGSLSELELKEFGSIIKQTRRRYDKIFKTKKASYMMMLFNEPVNQTKKYYFHFYLQFVCLDRDTNNLKYRASMETGLNIWTNDSSPEKVAEEFKNAE